MYVCMYTIRKSIGKKYPFIFCFVFSFSISVIDKIKYSIVSIICLERFYVKEKKKKEGMKEKTYRRKFNSSTSMKINATQEVHRYAQSE